MKPALPRAHAQPFARPSTTQTPAGAPQNKSALPGLSAKNSDFAQRCAQPRAQNPPIAATTTRENGAATTSFATSGTANSSPAKRPVSPTTPTTARPEKVATPSTMPATQPSATVAKTHSQTHHKGRQNR